MNFNTQRMQRIEIGSIFINNLILLLGVMFFGWTLFETLFLFWLEPLSAAIVLVYVNVIAALRKRRPSYHLTKAYQKPAFFALAIFTYVLIMHYFALVFIIDLCDLAYWDTSQGVWHTLAQLPSALWQSSLIFISILFVLAYLLPPILLERQGIRPSLENLPLQSKIMVHPAQFITNYALFGVVALVSTQTANATLIVLVLVLAKSLIEFILLRRITSQLV